MSLRHLRYIFIKLAFLMFSVDTISTFFIILFSFFIVSVPILSPFFKGAFMSFIFISYCGLIL